MTQEEDKKNEIAKNKNNKKTKVIVGAAIVIIFLIFSFSAIGDFLNPLRLVSEVAAQPDEYLNRDIQVVGFVVEGTWKMVAPHQYVFKLGDGGAVLDVELFGDPPGTLKPNAKITVIGKLVSPTKVVSEQILIQCPSKYEATLDAGIEKEKQKNA